MKRISLYIVCLLFMYSCGTEEYDQPDHHQKSLERIADTTATLTVTVTSDGFTDTINVNGQLEEIK